LNAYRSPSDAQIKADADTADEQVIKRAKKLAAKNRTSVSAMFSRMILAMMHSGETRSLLGLLTLKATGLIHVPADARDEELLEEAMAENL
jgi:hypothetical protein